MTARIIVQLTSSLTGLDSTKQVNLFLLNVYEAKESDQMLEEKAAQKVAAVVFFINKVTFLNIAAKVSKYFSYFCKKFE